jgi:hypothetical protein
VRELAAQRRLMVRSDLYHTLYQTVEQWTQTAGAADARRFLRILYEGITTVTAFPGSSSTGGLGGLGGGPKKRKWRGLSAVASLNEQLLAFT